MQFVQQKLLVTGGSGLLGRSIKSYLPKAFYPSTSRFNITNFRQMERYIQNKKITSVLHCAAFTSPPKVDQYPKKALETNIMGTVNIVLLCMKFNYRLLYMSSDYVFKGDKGNYSEDDPVFPVNHYAWSKLGGECAVRLYKNSLIIRTSFGPPVFPYKQAFIDQYTSRQSVDEIAKKIVKLLQSDVSGTIHIGGKRRSVHEYAKSLPGNKTIKAVSRRDATFILPRDTSLNLKRYNSYYKASRV